MTYLSTKTFQFIFSSILNFTGAGTKTSYIEFHKTVLTWRCLRVIRAGFLNGPLSSVSS